MHRREADRRTDAQGTQTQGDGLSQAQPRLLSLSYYFQNKHRNSR